MENNFVEIEKIEINDLKAKDPIKPIGHDCVVQVDTDSNYCCFEEYRKYFPMLDDVQFFYHLEKQLNHFWSRILDIKAKKNKMKQMIIFNRENMFTNFFSFARKMYMGDVVDSEGDMHWENPKKKIQGIGIKRTSIPDFARNAATELCFSIMRGMNQKDAEDFITKTYKDFLKLPIDDIAANAGVHEYNAYAQPIEEYIKHGLFYANKTPFSVKCAVNWNYVTTKEEMPVEPIYENGKYKYVYIVPNNKYKIEVIGFVGKWPEKFNEIFEVDYETQFRKTFLSTPEKMFQGIKWIRAGEVIPVVATKMKKFIR